MNLLPTIAELNFAAYTLGDWVKIIICGGAIALLLFSICGKGDGNKGGKSNQSTPSSNNTSQTQPPTNPQ